jgi:hypothetical protein
MILRPALAGKGGCCASGLPGACLARMTTQPLRRTVPLAALALAACTQVYTIPPGGGPPELAALYTTLPVVGTQPLPRPAPSTTYGHDGMYAGTAQALDSAGAQCAAFRHASNFRVEGRAVTFGPFRGTIGPEGGLRMIYGQSTMVGHFEADAFRGVVSFHVPPCRYAMLLRRGG